MKNILATIPRSKYPDWPSCERVLRACTGEDDFWLINTATLPKQSGVGAVCFMVFDGQVRGYFDIVDTDVSENWRQRHRIGKRRTTKCLVLANWHPCPGPLAVGFQGYRYTELHP